MPLCPVFVQYSVEPAEGGDCVAGVAYSVQVVELLPDVEVEGVGHVNAGVRRAAFSRTRRGLQICLQISLRICRRQFLSLKLCHHIQDGKERLQLLLIVVHPGAHDRSVLSRNEVIQPKIG